MIQRMGLTTQFYPPIHPTTTNVRQLREEEVVSLGTMHVQESRGQCCCFLLPKPREDGFKRNLGSLEVSSRREDWTVTPSVGICLASRCDDLLKKGKNRQR